jgi:hypothetical protein
MNYHICLDHTSISYPSDYVDYILVRYTEYVDYVLDVYVYFDDRAFEMYALNARRLICAHNIYFKNEEDALDFKLRYGK